MVATLEGRSLPSLPPATPRGSDRLLIEQMRLEMEGLKLAHAAQVTALQQQ